MKYFFQNLKNFFDLPIAKSRTILYNTVKRTNVRLRRLRIMAAKTKAKEKAAVPADKDEARSTAIK